MPLRLFNELLVFALESSNVFQTQSNTYKQRFGLPMGGILSTAISSIVLDHFFEYMLPYNMINDGILFFSKHVDDILCVLKKEFTQQFNDCLNDLYDRLFFTMNFQDNDSISYFDMTFVAEGKSIKTCWYQKEICFGRILNYWSHHPMPTKVNLARQFISKTLTLTDSGYKLAVMDRLKEIFRLNNYPSMFIFVDLTIFKILTDLLKEIADNLKLAIGKKNDGLLKMTLSH